jgi:hypothetical protein
VISQKFRDVLLASCNVESDKMVNSVSWAKFGENSLKDMQWNLIQVRPNQCVSLQIVRWDEPHARNFHVACCTLKRPPGMYHPLWCRQNAIAEQEGIKFEQVAAFLAANNRVEFV